MARSKVLATTLNDLLQDCAKRTPTCDSCVLGPVVELPADETGCNWNVSVMEGSGCFDCLAAMREYIDDMRANFFLDDPDMAPAPLTTSLQQ